MDENEKINMVNTINLLLNKTVLMNSAKKRKVTLAFLITFTQVSL